MANLLEHISVEMQIGMLPEVCPTEGGFKSVAVLDPELTPDHHSGCCLFRLLDSKGTVAEAKGVSLLLKNVRKDPLLELVVLGYRVTVYSLSQSRLHMKMFFFRECPWMSQTRNTSLSSWNFLIIYRSMKNGAYHLGMIY